MPTRLLLVRHGQIAANVDDRWLGSTDGVLTVQGREEGRRLAAHLARTRPDVTAVCTSPLQRAGDTAAAIADALSAPLFVEPGLAEYGIGVLENETYEDLAGRHRFFEQAEADLDWAPPGGESLNAVGERVLAAWWSIAHRHSDPAVVVSHGAALLDHDPRVWPRYRLRNTSISEIELEPTPRLLAYNLVDHLTQADS